MGEGTNLSSVIVYLMRRFDAKEKVINTFLRLNTVHYEQIFKCALDCYTKRQERIHQQRHSARPPVPN